MKNDRMIAKRKEKKMTQGDVAESVGCSQSMVALIEGRKRDPHREIKIKLAEFYGVTVEWLFYEKINDQESLEEAI